MVNIHSKSAQSVLFSSLPPEIRSQILSDSLPDKLEPALFPYKKGCWQPRHILESDEDYDPVNFFGIQMEYRHEFLDPVQVDVPLFFVNQEACSIAQAWMRKHDIKIRFHRGASQPIFVRYHYLYRDALYVPLESYNEFACEMLERSFESDLIGRSYSFGGREIPYIAVPERLFWTISTDFSDALFDWLYPAVLFIIVNASETSTSKGGFAEAQRIVFESTQWRSLVWDYEHRKFWWKDGEDACDQDLYGRIEEATNRYMTEKLDTGRVREFEIRPILADTR